MTKPILLWHRRDLRLNDNPALHWALAQGRPVVPVFLCDEVVGTWGAAPSWRLGLGIEAFAADLAQIGGRLVLRKGRALACLRALVQETSADTVIWNRLYTPEERARDTDVKEALRNDGLTARSFAGHLLFEPWTVETGSGGFYKVYTPFWKAVRSRDPGAAVPSPGAWPAPEVWPQGDDLASWGLARAMRRGAGVVAPHLHVGARAAAARLDTFIASRIATYDHDRDMLAVDGTSGLSENLTYGEISIRQCWHAGQRALAEGAAGAETFLKELVWRDFAHHLAYHTPHLTRENWKPEWDAFPWAGDSDLAEAWRRGRTGVAAVDAGMRELYVTGRMHNRTRMLVASYLTKHLMTHWKLGLDWFADTLVDWDPASNAMGWQWAAGSGPDAAPFFRIFNPDTQGDKFDPKGVYRRRWVAELSPEPAQPETARAYFQAIPKSWGMTFTDRYPDVPIVDLKEGRIRALEAYKQRAMAS